MLGALRRGNRGDREREPRRRLELHRLVGRRLLGDGDLRRSRWAPIRAVSADFRRRRRAPRTRRSRRRRSTRTRTRRPSSSGIVGSKAKATSGFQCQLKKNGKKAKPFKKCESPKTYKHLKPGKYTFKVKAFTPAGNDPSPAKKKFKIKP